MKVPIHREITPLSDNDCFMVYDRYKTSFTFPVHFHPEYELNYVSNAKGAKRIVGDHIDEIDDLELVLIGPNIFHSWQDYNNTEDQIHEITIQFRADLIGEGLLSKNIFKPIKELFQHAQRGVAFSRPTIKQVEDKLLMISKKSGFDSILELQSLLFDLATSRNQRLLTNASFNRSIDLNHSENIEKMYSYIRENFNKKIKLEDVAKLLNMSVVSFAGFIKQHTGKSFIDLLNEMRLGMATRQLIESNASIARICFNCGFNNVSNFNRIFKKKQGITPSEFRNNIPVMKIIY